MYKMETEKMWGREGNTIKSKLFEIQKVCEMNKIFNLKLF